MIRPLGVYDRLDELLTAALVFFKPLNQLRRGHTGSRASAAYGSAFVAAGLSVVAPLGLDLLDDRPPGGPPDSQVHESPCRLLQRTTFGIHRSR